MQNNTAMRKAEHAASKQRRKEMDQERMADIADENEKERARFLEKKESLQAKIKVGALAALAVLSPPSPRLSVGTLLDTRARHARAPRTRARTRARTRTRSLAALPETSLPPQPRRLTVAAPRPLAILLHRLLLLPLSSSSHSHLPLLLPGEAQQHPQRVQEPPPGPV